MSIKARIKRLEKKVAAAEVPGVEIGVFAGRQIWHEEEHEDGLRCFPLHTSEEFAAMASRQQANLLSELSDYESAIDAEHNEVPEYATFEDQLAPGAKSKPYRYFTDADGTEWQVEIATGQKWKV